MLRCAAIAAAAQAKKHEVARLQAALDKHEETDKGHREVIACVTRHWCALTEELKSTFLRLEHSPASIDTALPSTLIEQLSALKVSSAPFRFRSLGSRV